MYRENSVCNCEYHISRNNYWFFPFSFKVFFAYQSDSQTFLRSDDAGEHWQKLFKIKDTVYLFEHFVMWNVSSGFLLYADNHKRFHDLVTHDGGYSFTDF